MNEQAFILLMEEYLEGSITPQGRLALKAEVLGNPARRQLFENQARQHVRLHAQTSRIDFSESQRIAAMVMDIAEKQKEPNAFIELIRKKSFRERVSLIIQGLRADSDTSAHRLAKAELMRMVGPISLSVVVNVAALLLLLFWVPYVLPPPPTEGFIDENTITIGVDTLPPDLTPVTPTEPTPENGTPPDKGEPHDSSTAIDKLLNKSFTAPPELGGLSGDRPTPIPPGPELGPSTEPPPSFSSTHRLIPASLGQSPYGNRGKDHRIAVLTNQKAEKTDAAVNKALQWLKKNQSADGSWPGQDTTAMTGLALLTYLARNETPSSPEFGDTVTRGLQSLLKQQDAKGAFSQNVYSHAIATYALAEAYTMTRIMSMKVPLEKAVRVIINGQQSNGGFDYNYLKGSRFDTSVSGWQIQALKAAKTAEPDMEGLEEALARSTRFLLSDAVARDGSGFVYEGKNGMITPNGGKLSMTGVGTLCLQMLGKNTSVPVRSGLKLLQNAELEWAPDGKANVYTGYYVAQAKFQSGNPSDWMRWNLHMQKVLLAKQHKDGHWEQGDYDNGSHVYTTTLCVLMLEVYYRYLPSYAQRPESKSINRIASGDLPIDAF